MTGSGEHDYIQLISILKVGKRKTAQHIESEFWLHFRDTLMIVSSMQKVHKEKNSEAALVEIVTAGTLEKLELKYTQFLSPHRTASKYTPSEYSRAALAKVVIAETLGEWEHKGIPLDITYGLKIKRSDEKPLGWKGIVAHTDLEDALAHLFVLTQKKGARPWKNVLIVGIVQPQQDGPTPSTLLWDPAIIEKNDQWRVFLGQLPFLLAIMLPLCIFAWQQDLGFHFCTMSTTITMVIISVSPLFVPNYMKKKAPPWHDGLVVGLTQRKNGGIPSTANLGILMMRIYRCCLGKKQILEGGICNIPKFRGSTHF